MTTLSRVHSFEPSPHLAYDKLDATAARVFRLLAVCPGPDASTAAIAALADLPVSESRSALKRTAEADLVEVVPGIRERWRLHERARAQARHLSDALADSDGRGQALDRLFDYYLIAAEAADVRLRGLPPIPVPQEFTDRAGALAWLDAERIGLTAAVHMAADTGRDQAAKCLPLLIGNYLAFREMFNDLAILTTICLQAAQRLGDRAAEGDALTNLGIAWYYVRRYDEAFKAHLEAAAIFRETSDRQAQSQSLNNLALTLHGLGRDNESVTRYKDAIATFREISDFHGEGEALNNLGLTLRALRRFDEAASAHREAADIFRVTNDRHGVAVALGNLGNVLQLLGELGEAASAYRQAADIFAETGDQLREHDALEKFIAVQNPL